ncbi:tripartite tricarboxylate transporter substrate binding protein (plasmid) [Shinella sp. H4-D48]|uniref:Bug family tripartite tricarboxylate transporter substrate binding protein n=1 Tax=Shinella sp. H4-D48 TaxID=2925841 RepID=UPI001F531F67|nr:tripartite tricarboxylate transporter substrate binding protein [Shinella sp. H4-D48]UNK40601.1 tripartite tricarboxylate transporter substrate binding protein [Shinella sp. H4-D48]
MALKTYISALVGTLCLASFASPAQAEDFPCKSMQWIVPFSAGGGVDWMARVVVDELQKEHPGLTITVENRTGASGAIAAQALKAASADGCTVMSMSSSMLVAQAVIGADVGYDFETDFEPVINLASTPYFLTAWNSLGVKTLPELIAKAKEAPGTIPYPVSGQATLQAVVFAELSAAADISMIKVAYKGGGEMFADFLSGRVPLFLAFPYEVKQYIDGGEAFYLAVTSKERHPSLPDVPTVAETLPGYDIIQSYGVVAPKGVPANVVAILNNAIAKALHSETVAKKLQTETSFQVDAAGPEKFKALLKTQYVQYQAAAKMIQE